MTNWYWYSICILAGLMLGIIYFTWLWKDTKTLVNRHCLRVWFFHGIARSGLLVICFYLLSGNNWKYWIACLVGWTILRILILFKVLRQLNLTTGNTA